MELVTIAHDRIIVELTPPDCLRLAQACLAADHALAGDTIPRAIFGVEFGSSATLPVAALYQALAVAFETASYAGEASYHLHAEDVRTLSLAHHHRAAPCHHHLQQGGLPTSRKWMWTASASRPSAPRPRR